MAEVRALCERDEQALKLLNRLQPIAGDGRWVFPSPTLKGQQENLLPDGNVERPQSFVMAAMLLSISVYTSHI